MAHPKPDFTIKWGVNDEPITPIADLDQNEGWSFLGNTPPTAAQFDYMMALYDKRGAWLEEQLPSAGTTSYIRTLLDDVDAETAQTTLELGTDKILAQDGYYKLPGGLIVQWGEVLSHSSGSSINFPIAFPNECFVVLCQDHAISAATSVPIGVNVAPTTTSFIAYHDNADGPNFWFVAIGR